MELRPEHVVKTLLIVIFGALAAKIVLTYFSQFLDKLSGQNGKAPDLDGLIEAKKHMIRTGEYSQYTKENGPPPLPPALLAGQKPEEHFKTLLKNPTLSETEKVDLKKIINLFEESTWGGGTQFEKIQMQFCKLTTVSLDNPFFMRAFRLINSRQLLQELTSYHQAENLILCSAFLIKIINECIERQGPLLTFLGAKDKLGLLPLIRSLELLFLRQSKQSDLHLYAFLLQSKLELPSELSRLNQDEKDRLLEKILKTPKVSPELLFIKIIEEAQFFTSLSPLPSLKSAKDYEGAYALLGLKESSSDDEIKKRYRKLALERHPDKMAGRNIPKKYQELAHQNFTLIHQALDIISTERKKNA